MDQALTHARNSPFLSLPGKCVLIKPISRVIPLLHPLQIDFSLPYLGTHTALYPVLSLWHFRSLLCYHSCLIHWTVIPIRDWAMPFSPQYLGILVKSLNFVKILHSNFKNEVMSWRKWSFLPPVKSKSVEESEKGALGVVIAWWYISWFNCRDPMFPVSIIISFDSCRDWGSEKFKDLSQVTELL